MYFSKTFITAALLGFATAQTASVAASETLSTADPAATGAASSGTVVTHVVQVGGSNGSLVFSPNNVVAQVGELVQFQFNAKNHSVVQSTFANPCIPIQNVMPNITTAFYSGFMPTTRTFGSTNTTGMLSYTVRVMNTQPIWYYCAQAMHCQSGMVGAINAATSGNKTVAAFAALAAQASENLAPGQASSASASGAAASGAAATAAATGGSAATGTSTGGAAQQTTNAAPGLATDSFLGLALAGLAAFMAL